ncbi:MAG: Thiol peroxidase [Thermoanaerobaculia bacterium]|nr:Thiol peroxidase [Thermoanaerobaculia bacterium]
MEREKAVNFAGNMLTVIGPELKPGDAAPNFKLVANDLSEKTLDSFAGQTRIISVVPSLDTSVCDRQTRKFNELAASLPDTVVLTVSMDLPFAQKRWCGAAGIDKVHTLSDHRDGNFGASYGTLIKGVRLLQRAVFVVDAAGTVKHAEYVVATGTEPSYDAALAAAKA